MMVVMVVVVVMMMMMFLLRASHPTLSALRPTAANTLSRCSPQVDVYRVQRGSCPLVLLFPPFFFLSSFFWIRRIYWRCRLFRVMIVFLRSSRFTRITDLYTEYRE